MAENLIPLQNFYSVGLTLPEATESLLYTCPAGVYTIVLFMGASNKSTVQQSTVFGRLEIDSGDDETPNSDLVFCPDIPVLTNDSKPMLTKGRLTLKEGDKIHVRKLGGDVDVIVSVLEQAKK